MKQNHEEEDKLFTSSLHFYPEASCKTRVGAAEDMNLTTTLFTSCPVDSL